MAKSASLAQREAAVSRREAREQAGELVLLPECTAGFLVEYLSEIGPAVSTGFGPAPFGWSEVAAWQRCSGIALPPWQARLLVQLSREYAAFAVKAAEPDCPEPCGEEEQTADRREAVARSLRIGLRAMMNGERRRV